MPEGSLDAQPEAAQHAPTAAPGSSGYSPAGVHRAGALLYRLQRSAGNRAIASGARARLPQRGVARALIQRDAAAQALIVAALNKPAADAGAPKDGGAPAPAAGGVTAKPGDAGYQEAYRIINGMAMFDMVSTLTALKRSGQFDALYANLGTARGVFTDRIRVACDAVAMKGSTTADDFLLGHKDVIALLPVDQRENIVRYLDPAWFDDLKFGEDYAPALAAVRATPAYAKLDPAAHGLCEGIIDDLKKLSESDAISFYLDKLKQLLETPEEDPNAIAAQTQAETGAAVVQETKRVATPAAAKNAGLEEAASGSKKRLWVAKKGEFGGGTYYIDRGDPAHIFVKASVFLEPRGNGTDADVAAVKKMEDGIEKAASNSGYIVDLVFVGSAAPDALGNPPFTVGVDPGKWEVATNWAGGAPSGYAHELHHLMAFPLDRYDYIASHATNTHMVIPQRLYWFRQELSKPKGYNDPTSIMNTGTRHPNDDDVCRVAGFTGADLAACIAARQKARAAKAKGKSKPAGAAKP